MSKKLNTDKLISSLTQDTYTVGIYSPGKALVV